MRIFKKAILILAIFFILRIIPGCCDCDESTIPFNFNSIDIINLDNSGEWAVTTNSDTMKPGAVAFEVALFDSLGYFYAAGPSLNSIGFGQAKAMRCDCSMPFSANQSLKSIRITSLYALTPEIDAGSEVSGYFVGRPTNNSSTGALYTSLESICGQTIGKTYYDSGVESFGLFLTVPVENDCARFAVSIKLSDNTILTDTTRLIFIQNK
ncbi:MAG: hypothetical protein IPF68_05020 [Bacteroidales bacterium]|nr:hypothetical protein [Bacteroidales bacterium]